MALTLAITAKGIKGDASQRGVECDDDNGERTEQRIEFMNCSRSITTMQYNSGFQHEMDDMVRDVAFRIASRKRSWLGSLATAATIADVSRTIRLATHPGHSR